MSKAQDIAYEMAKYIVAELPIPDHLYDTLVGAVLDEEKQQEGLEAIDGQEAVVGDQ